MLKLFRNAYHMWLARVYHEEFTKTDSAMLDLRVSLHQAYERHAKAVA